MHDAYTSDSHMLDINDAMDRIHRSFGFLGKMKTIRHTGGTGCSNAVRAGRRAECGTAEGARTRDSKLGTVASMSQVTP